MQAAVDSKGPHLLTWIVGIAVVVFCLVGSAALMGWIPSSFGNSADSAGAARLSAAPKGPGVSKSGKAPGLVAEKGVMSTRCAECGVIESTRVVDTPGETSVAGVIGGAVVGGVLGNQVGSGRGKDIATVAGAVGGAVAGNEIEKRVRAGKRYETTVRFDDGSIRVFGETSPPPWRTGDRIKVIDGAIRLHG